MLSYYKWNEELETEEEFDELQALPPHPTPKDLEALYQLRNSEWFGVECETANYHSLDQWLEECAEFAEQELQLIEQRKETE